MGTTSGNLIARLLKDILPALLRETAGSSDIGRTILAFFDGLSGLLPPGPVVHHDSPEQVRTFLEQGRKIIRNELDTRLDTDTVFRESVETYVSDPEAEPEALWRVFFPEALVPDGDMDAGIRALRDRRVVTLDTLNSDHLGSVPQQLLFTSNVMITLPVAGTDLKGLALPEEMIDRIREVRAEEQRFWYDHPIPIGIAPSANELIYGLTGLAETLSWEKEQGNVSPDARLTVLLSVSVTHDGLKTLSLDYMRHELKAVSGLGDLDVYAFTEDDTEELAALLDPNGRVRKVFGVDGPYGRHYSFLKAVTALWQSTIDSQVRATFKIDLDQVFAQEVLLRETGKSAFEHFKTPLWGAVGKDREGRSVELGMIAGALVNEADIGRSLFTPDVPLPDEGPQGEDRLFFKQRPMALSTRAEMMTRYDKPPLDGTAACLSRIHVTGGTNGILIDSLRKYRPFTPGFIGRAEDQAYLMSVLFRPGDCRLRYLHADGLIMRHDKQAFAGEAIKAAKAGTYVGDLERTLYFSYYADAVPGGFDRVKKTLDPFTGCFVTKIPFTIVYFRLLLHLLSLLADGETDRAETLLSLGAERLFALIGELLGKNTLIDRYEEERTCWDVYYDALEDLEKKELVQKALESRIRRCLLTT